MNLLRKIFVEKLIYRFADVTWSLRSPEVSIPDCFHVGLPYKPCFSN